MKLSRRSRITTMAAATTTVIGAMVVASVPATATPGTGTATVTTFKASTSEKIEVEAKGLELHIEKPVDVVQQQFVANPGWSSGWHQHPGAVLVSVKSGTVTFYDGKCRAHPVGAGQVKLEGPGMAILARNEGSTVAEFAAVLIHPQGAAPRHDVPAPQDCSAR